MVQALHNPLDILNGRSKGLDSTYYSYKLDGQKQQYGMDAVVSEDGEVNESEMSIVLPFASGQRRDGVGDLLRVEGLDTSRHRKNPICLLDHGKHVALPIALAENPDTREYTVDLDTINKEARAKCWFYRGTGITGVDKSNENEHAKLCEQVFDLWAKKFLRAGSVGYSVIQAEHLPPDYVNGTPQGLDLRKILMLECSVVTLPASQDTVRKMLSMPSICGKPMSPWLVKSLQTYVPLETKTVTGYGTKGNMSTKAILNPVRTDVYVGEDGPATGSGRPTQRQLGIDPLGEENPIEDQERTGCSWTEADMKSLRMKYRIKGSGSRLFTRKGNVAGFTKDGKPIHGGYHNARKMWFVATDEYGRDQRHFNTPEEADAYAESIIDPKKTEELKWWGGKSYTNSHLESRDDYENPLSHGNVPAPAWKPGEGAMKGLRLKYRQKAQMHVKGAACKQGQRADLADCEPAKKSVKAGDVSREERLRLMEERAATGKPLFQEGDPAQKRPERREEFDVRQPRTVHYSGHRGERSLKGIKSWSKQQAIDWIRQTRDDDSKSDEELHESWRALFGREPTPADRPLWPKLKREGKSLTGVKSACKQGQRADISDCEPAKKDMKSLRMKYKQLYKVGDEVVLVRKSGKEEPVRILELKPNGMMQVLFLNPKTNIFSETVKQDWLRHKSLNHQVKSTRFTDWKEAHTAAQQMANQTGQNVAIRKVREYGKEGFNVSYASRNDSDYALAEIVSPGGKSLNATPVVKEYNERGGVRIFIATTSEFGENPVRLFEKLFTDLDKAKAYKNRLQQRVDSGEIKSISVNYRNKLIRGFAEIKLQFDLSGVDMDRQHAFIGDMNGAGFGKPPGRMPLKVATFVVSLDPAKLTNEETAVADAIRQATALANRHGARFLGNNVKE